MNEYEIAVVVGSCLAVLWFVAYVFCWIGQRAWAWVDDSEAGDNWFYSKIISSFKGRHKYTVRWANGKIYGYIKNKADHGKHFGDVNESEIRGQFTFISLTFLIPMFSPIIALGAFKLYPITLSIAVLCAVAYLARFTRRNKKMFDEHTKDKNAHA